MRLIKISFLLVLWSTYLSAQHPPSFAKKVYDKMFSTMSSGEVAKPRLVLTDNQSIVATYYPEQRELRISEKFIDLARNFGKDSSNVLAHVFGHELTHILIQRPASVKDIGTGYASQEVNKQLRKIDEVLMDSVYERQADEYAAFYAHISGYETTHIASRVLDSIYTVFELQDRKLKRYPSLAERKMIAEYSSKQMSLLNDIFENAIITTVIGEYDMAIGFYETIIGNKYTGKEIYNNLGTAYLLKAIQYLDSTEYPYSFPVQIDMNTNLNLTRSGIVDIQSILQSAHNNFMNALARDDDYKIAIVNKAVVEFLMEDYDNFDISLFKLNKLGGFENEVNLLTAIKAYHHGETKEAKKLLKKYKAYYLAERNYNNLFLANKSANSNNSGIKETQGFYLPEVSAPNVQREFLSQEAKVSDTLKNSIIGGDYLKRLVVNNEDFRSEWWVYYRVNAQFKYHEITDISKYIQKIKVDDDSGFDSVYKGFNRVYKLIDNKMFIFENDILNRILIID